VAEILFYGDAPLQGSDPAPVDSCEAQRESSPPALDYVFSESVAEWLRNILDSIPQMVWSAGAYGRKDYFNRQWDEFTGIKRGPNDIIDFDALLHPNDVDRVEAVRDRVPSQASKRRVLVDID
jgi:PAS domain-containing protein